MLLVAVIGFAINANAQVGTCKIVNPSLANATVMGQINYVDEDGYAHVSFTSEEPERRVNVLFTVTYTYPNNAVGNSSGAVGVNPGQDAAGKVYIGKGHTVTRLEITGAQCQ